MKIKKVVPNGIDPPGAALLLELIITINSRRSTGSRIRVEIFL